MTKKKIKTIFFLKRKEKKNPWPTKKNSLQKEARKLEGWLCVIEGMITILLWGGFGIWEMVGRRCGSGGALK